MQARRSLASGLGGSNCTDTNLAPTPHGSGLSIRCSESTDRHPVSMFERTITLYPLSRSGVRGFFSRRFYQRVIHPKVNSNLGSPKPPVRAMNPPVRRVDEPMPTEPYTRVIPHPRIDGWSSWK